MKSFIRLCIVLSSGFLFAACTIGNGRICGPQTPRAYCDKEAYNRLAHPKTYGEYWVKPNMTKESWRADWVSCGGDPSGQYGAYVQPGSTSQVIGAASDNKAQKLASCMQSKGYEYQSESKSP